MHTNLVIQDADMAQNNHQYFYDEMRHWLAEMVFFIRLDSPLTRKEVNQSKKEENNWKLKDCSTKSKNLLNGLGS